MILAFHFAAHANDIGAAYIGLAALCALLLLCMLANSK